MENNIIKINIKVTKTYEEYIVIRTNANGSSTMYSYYRENKNPILDRKHSSFNKWSFIEYLKGIQVKKNIIKEVEAVD